MNTICIILCCGLIATLVGCSKSEVEESNIENYVAVDSITLPEEITNVSRMIVYEDMAYICAQVKNNDGEHSCISTLDLDGSNYQQRTKYMDDSYILRDFVIDESGNIWSVCEFNSESAGLLQFDDSGTLLQTIELTSAFDNDIKIDSDTEVFINHDASGNIYVTVGYGKTYTYVFDNQGQYLFDVEDSSNPISVVTTAQGKVAVCVSDGTTACELLTIDAASQAWSEEKLELGSLYGVYDGSLHSFYIFDSSDFFGYSIENQSKEVLFNWAHLGLSTGDAHVSELSDGKFLALTGAFSQTGHYSYELTTLEPGEDDRAVLTMRSIQPDDSVLEAIAQFNKKSQKYRIELTPFFSSYDDVSDEDLNNAIEKFNLDIISGNIPDIIDLSNMPVEVYSEKGILEDLYSYIDTDPDINMDDYFDNIFKAFSIEGSLPYVTNGVMISTFLADSRIVGPDSGWTYGDISSLLDQYALDGLNSQFFMEKAVESSDSLIDWSTGESYFDSPEFIQLLELAAKVGDNSSSSFSGLAKNQDIAAVYNTTLSVHEVAQYNNLFQGNLNAIGLPNVQGTAYHAVSASTKIGISATSENKDGAWEFVKSFLEEKQQDSSYFFPIRKASFENVMNAAINKNSIWSMIYEGEITEQDVDIARSLLSTVHYSVSDNATLKEIIREESSAYFAGSRTAAEVSGNIQDRVQTYINEQR